MEPKLECECVSSWLLIRAAHRLFVLRRFNWLTFALELQTVFGERAPPAANKHDDAASRPPSLKGQPHAGAPTQVTVCWRS